MSQSLGAYAAVSSCVLSQRCPDGWTEGRLRATPAAGGGDEGSGERRGRGGAAGKEMGGDGREGRGAGGRLHTRRRTSKSRKASDPVADRPHRRLRPLRHLLVRHAQLYPTARSCTPLGIRAQRSRLISVPNTAPPTPAPQPPPRPGPAPAPRRAASKLALVVSPPDLPRQPPVPQL